MADPKAATRGDPYRTGAELNREIIVTTGNDVAGHRIDRYLGVVRGIVVRSPSVGQSFMGGFKQLHHRHALRRHRVRPGGH